MPYCPPHDQIAQEIKVELNKGIFSHVSISVKDQLPARILKEWEVNPKGKQHNGLERGGFKVKPKFNANAAACDATANVI